MSLGSVLNNGVSGVQSGFNTLTKAADKVAKVAQSESPTEDLTQSAVNLVQGKLQVQAASKVIAAADEALGSIIDIKV